MRITPVAWKRGTALFGKPRSRPLESVDRELDNYHKLVARGHGDLVDRIETLALHALVLYYALEEWKRKDRSDKDPTKQGTAAWKTSARNRSGMVTSLDAVLTRYVHFTTRYSHATLPASSDAYFATLKVTYDDVFYELFKDARMVPKNSFLREMAGSAAGGVYTVADHFGAIDAIERTSAGQFVEKIVEAVKRAWAADANVIRLAIHGLGLAENYFKSLIERLAADVARFAFAILKKIPGISLAADCAEAAHAFYGALSAHMKKSDADRARYVIRPGATTDAYNTVVQFWDDERAESLRDAAVSLSKALVNGVCLAVSAGAAAVIEGAMKIGEALYSASKKVVDAVASVLNVVKEIVSVNAALKKLNKGSLNNTKEVFELSPLLACYYFLSLETGHIVVVDSHYLGLNGFKQVVEAMKAKVDPVIAKAAEFLGASKFMFVKHDGTPLPVRARINNPTLRAQLQELAIGRLQEFAIDEVTADGP